METNAQQKGEEVPPVALSFGQIEAVLAEIHAIAPDKRVAFAGRLKALQRNGLPVGTRPGRGKAAEFSYLQFLQFAIGIELMQAGISPAPAAQIVRANWEILRHSIGFAFWTMMKVDEPERWLTAAPLDLLWIVTVRDFADLSRPKFKVGALDVCGIEPIQAQTLANVARRVRYTRGAGQTSSWLVINAGRLIVATFSEVAMRKFCDGSAVINEIVDPSTVVVGLKPSTPPWSAEAEEFFSSFVDERVIETAAYDFVDHAPNVLHQAFVDFEAVGLNSKNLDSNRLSQIADLSDWGVIFISDAGEWCLTRTGKVAIEALLNKERGHVDPEA